MHLIDTKWFDSLIKGSKSCLVGVSGGVDSMVLLHWLAGVKNTLPMPIKVMHINHDLHPDSNKWADMVEMTCINLGLSCEIKKVNISNFGKNIEFAAREARYTEFCKSGADTLLLAHHMNDQIETFFLKLFRGSGVRGLKSMPVSVPCWKDNKINVIRPLLNVTRSTIEAYASLYDIQYCEDPSNADIKYDRNYIRHQIWPVIRERFDIADINISKSIDLLGEAWELTTVLATQDLTNCTLSDGILDWTKIKSLGMLRIKNLILHILTVYQIYGYSIGHIEQFAQVLASATMDSKNELSLKGFRMFKQGKKIIIEK